MDDVFIRNTKRRGPQAVTRLEKLPELIASYEKKWRIKVGKPFALSYNYVAQAIQEDGTEVVIKIGFPEDREFYSEIEALEIFNGDGIERLIKEDRENAVLLLEKVIPGAMLATLTDY